MDYNEIEFPKMTKRISSIIATTHIDAHNQRFAKEALEQMAIDVNTGNKPPLTLMHDVTIPPLGKMLSAVVERREDGEYQLVVESEIFEHITWTEINGTKLAKGESIANRKPFVDKYKETSSEQFTVAVDVMNFESYERLQSFMDELKEESPVDFVESNFGRKSAIPDPEIIIGLAKTIVAFLLGKKLIDKIAENVVDEISSNIGDDIAEFYTLTKTAIVSFVRSARPKNRPITYIFVLKGQPNIEFVARTTDSNLVLSAIHLEKMQGALEQARPTIEMLDAMTAQFLLNDAGEWEFNYMLTKTGGVIGTEQSYKKRDEVFEIAFSANAINSDDSATV